MADNMDKERNNWFMMCYAMSILTEGLQDCVENNVTSLYQRLYTKCACLPTCATNCSKSESSCDTWCPNCCLWKKELLGYHKKERATVQWKYIDSSKWSSSAEEITKVFIQNLRNGPKLILDIPNIMSLFENCTLFHIQKDQINAIRKVRNEYICHNGKCKINDNDLPKCFNRMFTLLHDPSIKDTPSGKVGLEKLNDLKENGINNFLKDKSQENNDFAKLVISVEQLKNQNCDIQEQLTEIKKQTLQKECIARNTTGINRFTGTRNVMKWILSLVFGIIIVLVSVSTVSKDVIQHKNETGCMTMEFMEPWKNEIGFKGYLSDHVNLTGRGWLIEQITSETTTSEGGLLLSAEMGYGKTALISKLLCADSSSIGYTLRQTVLAFHMCKYDVLTTQQPDIFVRNIAGKIASDVPEFELEIANSKLLESKRCTEDPIGCLDNGLIFPLKQIPKQDKYIIVIDALDECDSGGSGGHTVLSLLIKRIQNFPKWIKFILTSRNISSITTRFPNLKHMHLDERSAKHLGDIEKYVAHRLSSLNNVTQTPSTQGDIQHVSQALIQRSSGNFLFLKHMLDLIIKNKQIHSVRLPDSLDEAYLQNFERVFAKDMDLFKKTKVIFEIICASYEPLKESVLLDIAKLSKHDIDEDIFQHLSHSLGHFFNNHAGTLYFTHKAIRDWLLDDKRKYGSFSISLRKGHELISKYYISQVQKHNLKNLVEGMLNLPLHVSMSKEKAIEEEFLQTIETHSLNIRLFNVSDTFMHFMSRKVNDYTAMKLFYKLSVKYHNIDSRNEANVTSAFIAAAYGHAETLRALHELGADISFKVKNPNTRVSCTTMDDVKHIHYWGYNLLHISAQNGHFDCSKYLVQQNKFLLSDRTSFGLTPFHLAAEFGHEEILKLFLSNGYSSVDQTSLHHAAANGHLKVVDLLLKHGAVDECLRCDGTFQWLDENVVRIQSHFSIMNEDLKTSFQDDWHLIICESALEASIRNGQQDVMERLLEEKINAFHCTEYGGRTPLMTSVKYGHFEIFKSLVEKGADIFAKCVDQQHFVWNREKQMSCLEFFTDYLPHLCPLRASAAHILAMYNQREMALYLLEILGKRWYSKDDTGANALHYAACHNSLSMIHFLVERVRMNVCSRTDNGSTPYHSAVSCNSYQALSLLRNIRPSRVECLKDSFNLTLLHYAFLPEQPDSPLIYYPENLMLIDEIMILCRYHTIYISKSEYKRIFEKAIQRGYYYPLQHLYYNWNFQVINLLSDDEIRKVYFDAAFYSLPDISLINIPRFHQTLSLTLNSSNMVLEPLMSPYDKIAIWLLDVAGFKLNSADIRKYMNLVVQKGRYKVLLKFLDFDSDINIITALDNMLSAGDGTLIQDDHLQQIFLNCDRRSTKYPLHKIVMNRNNLYWRYSPHFNDFLNKTLQNVSARYLDKCFDAEGYNILHRAIIGGHIAAVNFLTDKGMSLLIKPTTGRDIILELVTYAPNSRNMKALYKEPIAYDSMADMYYLGSTMVKVTCTKSKAEFTSNFDSTASFVINKYIKMGRSYTVCKNGQPGLSAVHIAATKGIQGFLRTARRIYGTNILDCENEDGITPLYLAKMFNQSETARYIKNNLINLKLPNKSVEDILILKILFSFNITFPRNSSVISCMAPKTILPIWRGDEKFRNCVNQTEKELNSKMDSDFAFAVKLHNDYCNSIEEEKGDFQKLSDKWTGTIPYIFAREFFPNLRKVVYRHYNFADIQKMVHERFPSIASSDTAHVYLSAQRYMFNRWLQQNRQQRKVYIGMTNSWLNAYANYTASRLGPCLKSAEYFSTRRDISERRLRKSNENILSSFLKYGYLDALRDKDTGIYSRDCSCIQRGTVCNIRNVKETTKSDYPLFLFDSKDIL